MSYGWSHISGFCRHLYVQDDVVAPLKLIFYKPYVDDTYVRKKKNTTDKLFEKFNIYHDNIKITIEENPTKFLDT